MVAAAACIGHNIIDSTVQWSSSSTAWPALSLAMMSCIHLLSRQRWPRAAAKKQNKTKEGIGVKLLLLTECGTRATPTHLEPLYLLRFTGLGRVVCDHLDASGVPCSELTQHNTTQHNTTPHNTNSQHHVQMRRSAGHLSYVSELAVSSALYSDGDTLTNMRVLALPPSPS